MKKFSIQDIRSWDPCYDPTRHLPEDWGGTVLDILRHEAIPPQDKLWVVCREDLLDAKTLRLFAVWCARQVEHLMTDERSRNALDVAERHANGEATDDELAAAIDAAWDAATDAATDAAWNAAGNAASAAARNAESAAARNAARDAARNAARDAAWKAESAAARNAQIAHLIEMLEE